MRQEIILQNETLKKKKIPLFSVCFLKPFVFCYIYFLYVFVYLHILFLLFAPKGPPRARQSKRSQTQVS